MERETHIFFSPVVLGLLYERHFCPAVKYIAVHLLDAVCPFIFWKTVSLFEEKYCSFRVN